MSGLLRSAFSAVSAPCSRLSALRTSSRLLTTVARAVPPRTTAIRTPEEFLKAIGRSSDTKVTLENWDELWGQTGATLKAAGVDVKGRRYILRCLERYRQGLPVEQFAHEVKPKKTIRGWGPKVQNGKRIRSRRDRHQISPAVLKRRKVAFKEYREVRKASKRQKKLAFRAQTP